MTTVQIPTRRLMFASAVAIVFALAPMVAAGPTSPPTPSPRNVQAATRRTTTPCSVLPARCLTSTTSSAKQRWLNQASMQHRAVVEAVAPGALEAVDIVEQLHRYPSATR